MAHSWSRHAQLTLHGGANDMGSIMIEENVVWAGAPHRFKANSIQNCITDSAYSTAERSALSCKKNAKNDRTGDKLLIDVTGIIEIADIVYFKKEGNLHLSLKSRIANELKVDQSIAHNGVCLTVIDIHIDSSTYTVTAVRETYKSSLGLLDLGSKVNLEKV